MKLLSCVAIAFVAAILPNGMVEGDCPKETLKATKGDVHVPTGADVKKDDDCIITIAVDGTPAPTFVTLMMSEIVLSEGGVLEVYDGDMAKPENLLYTVNDTELPQKTLITFSNNVNLKYHVGDLTPASSWNISYISNECEMTVENPWVLRIDSPIHLPTADKTFNCKYTVTNNLPDNRIQAVSMLLELTDKNTLTLKNNQTEQTYDDKTAAEDFFAMDNTESLIATYKVTDATTKPSFTLIVDPVIKDCSGKTTLDKAMSVTLDIKDGKAAQYDCRWLLVAKPDTSRFLAKVTTLTLVAPSDILRFMDSSSSSQADATQASLTATSNGASLGYLFATSSNSLIVTLSLGNSGGDRKLIFDVSPEEYSGRFIGSGTLSAGGTKDADVTIPAYFQLMASPKKVLKSEVPQVLPENATLTFYDGLQTSDKVLALFNSKTTSDEMVAIIGGQNMLLVLEKFPSKEKFTATFESIDPGCDQLLTDVNGQMTFVGVDSSSNDVKSCTITISPYNAVGDTLVLNFDSLTIGDKESVMIYSGDTKVAEFSAENSQASEMYISQFTTAKIMVMGSTEKKIATKLSGRYSVKADVCGGELSTKSAMITTPNFPNQYPLNAQCTWSVPSGQGESDAASTDSLYLNFKSLNLAPGHSIKVTDMKNKTSEELASYMGSELPEDFIVPVTTGLSVQFSAMANDAGMKNQVAGGASISYNILSCGGNISGDGKIFSPGYPTAPTESASCIWIIEAATPEPNSTNILTMNITFKDDTIKTQPATLEIHDGPFITSQLLSFEDIKKGKAGPILSFFNKVVIKYTYKFDSATKDKAGFNLTFQTYKCNASQLCDNGHCMHPGWICNGYDDCRDGTDERDCKYTPAPVTPSTSPKPPSGSSDTSGYVKGGYVALVFFIALILGAVLVLLVPKIIRKIRGGGRSYSRMNDSAPVVT